MPSRQRGISCAEVMRRLQKNRFRCAIGLAARRLPRNLSWASVRPVFSRARRFLHSLGEGQAIVAQEQLREGVAQFRSYRRADRQRSGRRFPRCWLALRKSNTSCGRIRPVRPVFARLRSIVRTAWRFFSTNIAEAAPRLSASSPSAPVPAKRSSTRAPMTRSPRLEKIAALTRSIVGRISFFGTSSRMPPALPAMTLMASESGVEVGDRRASR